MLGSSRSETRSATRAEAVSVAEAAAEEMKQVEEAIRLSKRGPAERDVDDAKDEDNACLICLVAPKTCVMLYAEGEARCRHAFCEPCIAGHIQELRRARFPALLGVHPHDPPQCPVCLHHSIHPHFTNLGGFVPDAMDRFDLVA